MSRRVRYKEELMKIKLNTISVTGFKKDEVFAEEIYLLPTITLQVTWEREMVSLRIYWLSFAWFRFVRSMNISFRTN